MKKGVKAIQQRPPKDLFSNKKVGGTNFKGLVHKDSGEPFDDVDYFELLGRKAIQMDNDNPNKRLPTDYGIYDKTAMQLGKEVVKALDDGMSKEDILLYLNQCVELPHEESI